MRPDGFGGMIVAWYSSVRRIGADGEVIWDSPIEVESDVFGSGGSSADMASDFDLVDLSDDSSAGSMKNTAVAGIDDSSAAGFSQYQSPWRTLLMPVIDVTDDE